MASLSSLLSEEQIQCSICLDVFTEPVTTPCGHNFCKACISGYWNKPGLCQCPMCKDMFYRRPELKINTTLRDVADHFKRMRDRDDMEVFTALVRCIERSQAEFIEVVEEKLKAAEWQAEGLIKELEQEITELQRRCSELEQLLHTKDHLHLLQSSPPLCKLPPTRKWPQKYVHSRLCLGNVRRVVYQLEDALHNEMEKLPDIKLKRMQQYAVDVTLDPDTAFPFLILGKKNRKQVRCGDKSQENLTNDPKRFKNSFSVLGKEGFSSGRFYYEVQVTGKTWWWLGVASESIDRKESLNLSSDGLWTVWLNGENGYGANNYYPVRLSLREKPQKVGVFVDYEKGQVSFYDVKAKSHIYSYYGCNFTEKLYPYFNPYLSCSGENSAPLVISSVNHKQ
ncbi:unnamed protein product [Oncorhynchus mykiss]|uniref:Uncharacterized protein n=1 Tax=Oncorhynchus mykiss TaxID=8022 RepID=A0A060XSD3_ONCMY|nr:unnamed protein product [Oncorhynchus mykiss]